MFYSRYERVEVKEGVFRPKIFACGDVVRINDVPGMPFSFNLAIGRGPKLDPIFVNRIAVARDKGGIDALRKMQLGQQLTCEINIVESKNINPKTQKPYENLWLHSFEWCRRPDSKPGEGGGY